MNKKLFLLSLIVLAALALAGCGLTTKTDTPTPAPAVVVQAVDVTATPAPANNGQVVVEGNIVPRDSTRLYTRAGGQITEVLVKKGDTVKKDDVLVRMGDREQAEAALTAAKLEQTDAEQALTKLTDKASVSATDYQNQMTAAEKDLIDAQQKLADLDDDQYQTDLDNAKTDVGVAKKELDDAQKEWDKYKDLDPSNQTRKSQKTTYDNAVKKYDDAIRKRDLVINKLDQAKAEVDKAQAAYDDAKREYEKRKDNKPAADDLSLAQARVDNAKAQVVSAQKTLDDLEIKAPFDGTIVELDVAAGETLLANQQVAQLADLNELFVETNDLTEMDVVKVKMNQGARVKPDALPTLGLPATVTEIAQVSGKKGGDVTYTVRLKLDRVDPALRWGMTVEVRFDQ